VQDCVQIKSKKKLHFFPPVFVGSRMPGLLFRDDFVGQENGFFRRKGARPGQGFALYLRIGVPPQLIPPAKRLRW
jgi:hypothetical protein